MLQISLIYLGRSGILVSREAELWKPVSVQGKLWPYMVSSLGRIRRGEKILKPGTMRKGYLKVNLWQNGESKAVSLASIVLESFQGPRPAGREINHINGTKTDNRVGNLEWVTSLENHQHATRMGLSARGTKNGSSKLVEAQVLEIRSLLERNITQREIANRYGVDTSLVSLINTGEVWGWL